MSPSNNIADYALVDVRTPAEFSAGNVDGSINIPLDQIGARLDEFRKLDKPILVFCQSGNRSENAKAILADAGIKNVTNGGSWQALEV